MRLIDVGTGIFFLFALAATPQLLIDEPSAGWFWTTVSLYMLGMGVAGPSIMTAILEPLPQMSGRVASITGTFQIVVGAGVGSLAAAAYDGTTRPMLGLMLLCALMVCLWWPLVSRRHVVIGH